MAATRCITADAPGTYTVTVRNINSGRTESCSQTLAFTGTGSGTGDNDDLDQVVWDNCPRDPQFWRRAFDGRVSGVSQAELRTLARLIDDRSTYFNWSNDMQGMREALNPASPLTRRKQLARQYATLLANVIAGEQSSVTDGGDQIRLDLDTRVDFPGAPTVRDLIVLTDRTLKAGRGSYARLNTTLNSVNRGRGIGPVCE